MNLAGIIGGLLLVAAVGLGVAARRSGVASGGKRAAAARTYRRVAWVFAVVGLGLIFWQLVRL